MFVSGGAGSVGSMAGQIAGLLGAGRVIGSTGTATKARWMTAELGYDAGVVRGAGTLADQLAKAAPDGLDVVADQVGGEDLQAAATTRSWCEWRERFGGWLVQHRIAALDTEIARLTRLRNQLAARIVPSPGEDLAS